MADYRRANRTRCTRCETAVPYEELFMTSEGAFLCASCQVAWAEDQHAAAVEGFQTGLKKKPGYRLVCPACEAATMETRGGEMLLRATCTRCARTVTRLQSGAFLAGAVLLILALFIDFMLRFLVVTPTLGAICALILVNDVWGRARHRVATFEQLEAADLARKAERVPVQHD